MNTQSSQPGDETSPRIVARGAHLHMALWIALIIFALDQTHKWWMLLIYKIEGRGRVPMTSFLDVVYVLNKGISYGLLTGNDQAWQVGLAAFAVVASLGLALWIARTRESRIVAASVGLIIGGALGNALDRVILGGVADFFSLHAFGYYWYVFNIADIAIVAGVLGLLCDAFVPAPKRERGANADAASNDATKPSHLRRRVNP